SVSSYGSRAHRCVHSFPTRRSSDLPGGMRMVRQLAPKAEKIYVGAVIRHIAVEEQLVLVGRFFYSFHVFVRQAEMMADFVDQDRSEEHTSELQSRENLVCRLLLEKK